MPRKVLDVGQCDYDHGNISRLLQTEFQAEVTRTHDQSDTLAALAKEKYDLVLINRLLDVDHTTEGLSILKAIKSDARFGQTPVMLVTNFPEHQALSLAAGGAPGFGKKELALPATKEKLAKFLG